MQVYNTVLKKLEVAPALNVKAKDDDMQRASTTYSWPIIFRSTILFQDFLHYILKLFLSATIAHLTRYYLQKLQMLTYVRKVGSKVKACVQWFI